MASNETPIVDSLDDTPDPGLEEAPEPAPLTEILGEASEADAVEQRAEAAYDGDDDYR